jgi:NADH-quinone oxidoreductase subunit M
MNSWHFPWLELAILFPLLGAGWVSFLRDADRARKWFLVFSGSALLWVLLAWHGFATEPGALAVESGSFLSGLLGPGFFQMDVLNAPLLALTALLYVLTAFSKTRTSVRRFSFAWTLGAMSVTLAMLGCQKPWGVITFLAIGVLPPLVELRARHKPTGVFITHMAVFLGLLILGWTGVEACGATGPYPWWVVLPIAVAILIRSGIAPFHCWITDLFEHSTFGTALLFITPMSGAYAAVRLLFPIAPEWILSGVGVSALVTALYAAGMALAQHEVRRFFCYLFLSHSALVLVGMDTDEAIGLTGGLCVWLSVALALAGFGQTLRALEARHGRLSLKSYHGLYEHTPALAVCFLLTGLASVGFPGTIGFLGTELLVDGAVEAYPYVGVAVVLVAALNGIAVVKAYFLLFTGTKRVSAVPLGIGARERLAVLTFAVLILVGGLFPQSGVESRHQAAEELLKERELRTSLQNEARSRPVRWFADPDLEAVNEAPPHDDDVQ